MQFRLRSLLGVLTLLTPCASLGVFGFEQPAEQPYSLKNYKAPAPLKKDEPLAKQFSPQKAAQALDSASLEWVTKRKCFTCHTNVAYLYARPLISADDPAPQEIRQALESLFSDSKKKDRGIQTFHVTAEATTLAINDSITTKKLHPLTKKALDQMWKAQGPDGVLFWGGGDDPVGSTHYGLAIIGVAVSVAPEGYAQTEAAKKGLDRIRSWLKKNPPKALYDKAMILWASCHVDGYLTAEEKAKIIAELRGKQLADGGWSLMGLSNRQAKGAEKAAEVGDGYATGLSIYALRQAGIPADDPAIKRGIAWLKANQRESGRWFTPSLNSQGSNLVTNAGSAFAIMALHACNELNKP